MKLTIEQENYSATVIKIHHLVELEGADKLVGIPVHGFQAITSKDTPIGTIGIIFPAGCQLSGDFCRENNLFRDNELNKDKSKKSYLETNRRIKAIRLIKGKHISSALFMPLSSLEYLGINTNDLKEGDSFTHINGVEICRKYVIPIVEKGPKNSSQKEKIVWVDEKQFPEHIKTVHFLKHLDEFYENDYIIVTEKIHSTSARFANIQVPRKLSLFEKIAKYLGVKVQTKEWKTIAGSRRTIKTGQSGYYKTDVWNKTLTEIAHLIPKNVEIFGEIAGWDGDKPLQKRYTYQIPQGQTKFYIYRIASVNEDGFLVDWSWTQIKLFCKENGLNHVPEVFRGHFKDFDYTKYTDKKLVEDLGLTQCLPLDEEAPCSEGLVIRLERERYIPFLVKYKNPAFLTIESSNLDSGVMDIEEQEERQIAA